MSLPEAFIRRPVATILLTLGIALTGVAAYFVLPVAALPTVDFPTIQVRANMAGASPEVMATSVATPLERHLGLIANVTEMTSNSTTGSTNITLQFGLNRDIDGAARDVQAAIAAARADLPTALRSNPTYRKVNPADAPIVVLYLQSETMTTAQIYDAASNTLQQKLSQINGVGDVSLGGGAAPAVRVDFNPRALAAYGISPEDIRAAISATNANQPKGYFTDGNRQLQIYANDQAMKASDYAGLVIATRHGASVRLSDVATVYDGPESTQNLGLANGKEAIVIRVTKSPGANVIETVDRIKEALPVLRAELPPQIDLNLAVDRTITTRASLLDVERTLGISTLLVVGVVFLFLRNGRATVIPALAVVVSLLGSLAFMYLFHLSLDNLSFMALTVATGFVVDDAIVVLENITRHVEEGMPPFKAAIRGASEVAFTVLSISISLIAVFIPLLFMGGVVGRLFNEFAVVLAASVMISLLVSLTTTPMLSARLIDPRKKAKAEKKPKPDKDGRPKSPFFLGIYEKALNWSIDHKLFVLIVLFIVIGLNVYLYVIIPKGFLPQQDTGQIQGGLQVDQASSFALTSAKMRKLQAIVASDPAVETVVGFTGSGGGFTFGQLKPKAERGGLSSDDVLNRLRPKLSKVPGAQLYLQVSQDFRVGGRQSNLQYQYTLESDDSRTLKTWSDALMHEMQKRTDVFADVSTDQQVNGLASYVTVDRATASKLGLTSQQVDSILYDYFGQRQVSNIYGPLNQYHVVMEADPMFAQGPEDLRGVYLPPTSGASATTTSPANQLRLSAPAVLNRETSAASGIDYTGAASELYSRTPAPAANPFAGAASSSGRGVVGAAASNGQSAATVANLSNGVTGSTSALSGAGVSRSTTGGGGAGQAQTGNAITTSAERMIPLSDIATFALSATPVSVNHQDQSVAATLSFDLAPGKALSDAQAEIADAVATIGMPGSIHGSFGGTAATAQQSNSSQGLLILAAIVTIYIVLGILYESYVHPITVLSTLPSAGIGALLALMAFHTEFSLIALIGVILLIGLVKKNAILIIDFALARERAGWSAEDAIFEACRLRFRPIMMTTAAAVLGAVPLAFGFGEGAELRQPLGVTIIGGLIASQALTLLTTPVVYLYMDKLRLRFGRKKPKPAPDGHPQPSATGA
ncbi:efflux RND transporter permease subunit [Asticcacaulis solisilvae]|uniref:efflux RND transporter permease subunit n=1 Tax=Asticcacaulis solisilvae TaxID=1217274 RepID=UPI003FD7C817